MRMLSGRNRADRGQFSQAPKEVFGPRHDEVEHPRRGRCCGCHSRTWSLREQETPHQDSVRRAGTAPTEGAIHDPLPVTSAAFDAHQQRVSRVSPEEPCI